MPFDPLGGTDERLGLEPARPILSVPAASDETGPLEHLQMLRDGLHAHVERLGQLIHGRLPAGQPGQHRTAGRIGKGGERDSQRIVWHMYSKYQGPQPNGCSTDQLTMIPSIRNVKGNARRWSRRSTVALGSTSSGSLPGYDSTSVLAYHADVTLSLPGDPPPIVGPYGPPLPVRIATRGDQVRSALRRSTADLRAKPDFVIIGTQRGGTTSLYTWLSSHPQMTPTTIKEIHYFDVHYSLGPRWYRSHMPLRRPGVFTGHSCPYMLFHPLAPERAASDLPETTKFIVLLREPVQRTVSHYWYSRRLKRWENEPLERALDLEEARIAGEEERIRRGERSMAHTTYSYVARSEYARQLRTWFDAVGRERILVIESERMYADPAVTAGIVEWLGLRPHDAPLPVSNRSERLDTERPEVLARLADHFEPHNRELFDLLGYELWGGSTEG